MYTAGGGGNSHTTLSKFQYMPSGQGGGGGWARLTAGEASSISGRNANTTADTALRCSQGFIGHLLSVAFCVEILRFVRCPGAPICADGGEMNGLTSIPGIRVCVVPCEGFGPTLQWRICRARWSVDLSYALIRCGSPIT